jgi:hypothetical protein
MELAEIIKALGYTREWLEWDIVDEPYLQAQYAEYCRSDDKNQEHYRCGAFNDFLKRRSGLTDDQVDKIFRLTDNGPDRCDLADNRAIALIHSGVLSDEQHFAMATRHPRVLAPPIQRMYQRETLLRKIRQSGIAETFGETQASGDREVQCFLLEHPDLAREHLKWLAESGANKAIRNRAAALLGSKRFRD